MDEEDWRVLQKDINELDIKLMDALIDYPIDIALGRVTNHLFTMCEAYYGKENALVMAMQLITRVSIYKSEKNEIEDE